MKPYYEEEGIQIFHGDCREFLPSIEPESVDLVLTDPPFNVGFDYRNGFNDRLSSQEYGDWLRECIRLCEPLLRPGAWNFWWMAMPHCHHWGEWFPEGWRIFAAAKDFVQMRPTAVQYSWDPVVFWRKDGPKAAVKHNSRDFHLARTSRYVPERWIGDKHPCMRPLDTAQYIVALATENEALILDPLMGSGTTLLAAKNLNRKAIGIEIEEKYAEIAAKRLSQEVLPLETA